MPQPLALTAMIAIGRTCIKYCSSPSSLPPPPSQIDMHTRYSHEYQTCWLLTATDPTTNLSAWLDHTRTQCPLPSTSRHGGRL